MSVLRPHTSLRIIPKYSRSPHVFGRSLHRWRTAQPRTPEGAQGNYPSLIPHPPRGHCKCLGQYQMPGVRVRYGEAATPIPVVPQGLAVCPVRKSTLAGLSGVIARQPRRTASPHGGGRVVYPLTIPPLAVSLRYARAPPPHSPAARRSVCGGGLRSPGRRPPAESRRN